tara:strand:+ start:2045 stop:2344 length:300 start_codon:yes stop_codon:yes gene_type:complete
MITLGETEYKARLTVDAIVKIETTLDKGILLITQRLGEADVRVSELRTILLHALRGGGKDLQEKDVDKIIAETGIVGCCKAVAELLTASLVSENEQGSE